MNTKKGSFYAFVFFMGTEEQKKISIIYMLKNIQYK